MTPHFKINDVVSFTISNDKKTGVICIIDPNGTYETAWKEPSYDVYVESNNTLYKHLGESLLNLI